MYWKSLKKAGLVVFILLLLVLGKQLIFNQSAADLGQQSGLRWFLLALLLLLLWLVVTLLTGSLYYWLQRRN